eukprot:m.44807 g.44807  ORF g.44807 m.44807 type:complete len:415 (-) comp10852_c0_seq2:643-1887(-)
MLAMQQAFVLALLCPILVLCAPAKPGTPTSADCTLSSCVVTWSAVQDGLTSWTLRVSVGGLDSTFACQNSTDTFCNVNIAGMLECLPMTMDVIARSTSGQETVSDSAEITPSSAAFTPTPALPSISSPSFDRFDVSFTWTFTNNLWLTSANVTVRLASNDQLVSVQTIEPTHPASLTATTKTLTISGLQERTLYKVAVRFGSCTGLSAFSSTVEQRTTLNHVLHPDAENPVFVYAAYDISGIPIDADAFSTDIFFAGLRAALRDFEVEVERADFGVVELTEQDTRLFLKFQINVTELVRPDTMVALVNMTDPPCAGVLALELKSTSSVYTSGCIEVSQAPTYGSRDFTADESEPNTAWKMPVIIAASCLGGLILLGVLIYIVVQLCTSCREERKANAPESKVNFGIELSKASMY